MEVFIKTKKKSKIINKYFRQESLDKWVTEAVLEGHEDWVRDVAWAPSENQNLSTIASCGMVINFLLMFFFNK